MALNDLEMLLQAQRIIQLSNELEECYDSAIEMYRKAMENAKCKKDRDNAALKFSAYLEVHCDPIAEKLNWERNNIINLSGFFFSHLWLK